MAMIGINSHLEICATCLLRSTLPLSAPAPSLHAVADPAMLVDPRHQRRTTWHRLILILLPPASSAPAIAPIPSIIRPQQHPPLHRDSTHNPATEKILLLVSLTQASTLPRLLVKPVLSGGLALYWLANGDLAQQTGHTAAHFDQGAEEGLALLEFLTKQVTLQQK